MRRTVTALLATAFLVVGLAACQPKATNTELSITKQGFQQQGFNSVSCSRVGSDKNGNQVFCKVRYNGAETRWWSDQLSRTRTGGYIRFVRAGAAGGRTSYVGIKHMNGRVTSSSWCTGGFPVSC